MKPSLASLCAMKSRGEKIAMLTAYDFPTARLLEEAGIDILLVGDSLGMVVLGYPDTTQVTMEEMLHHTRAVARGAAETLILADLPIHSYDTPEQAVSNARRLLEAGADAGAARRDVRHPVDVDVTSRAPLDHTQALVPGEASDLQGSSI